MKKVVSLALAILLVIHLGIPMVYGATSYSYTDTTVTPITEEDISLVFGGSATAGTEITKAKYVYSFTEVDATVDLADVVLNLTVYIGSTTYTARLTGRVNGYSLSSGVTLWEGPVSGSMTVRGTVYTVTAGFARLSSSTNAQVSVVMQPASSLNNGILAAFVFGYGVITQSIGEELELTATSANGTAQESSISIDTPPDVDSMAVEPNVPYIDLDPADGGSSNVGDYVYLGGQAAYFDNDCPELGYGQESRIYYNTDTNTLMVGVRTYCSRFNGAMIDNWPYVTTSVRSIGITVEDVSSLGGQNEFDIDGLYEFNYDSGIQIGSTLFGSISAAVEDMLSAAGLWGGVMVTILEDVFGNITIDDNSTDKHSLQIRFNTNSGVTADGLSTGFPVIYSLSPRNTASYVGDSEVQVSTIVEYCAWFSGSEVLSWSFPLYSKTEQTVRVIEFTI